MSQSQNPVLAVCAWHKPTPVVMDAETGAPLPGVPLAGIDTHGVCNLCDAKIRADAGLPPKIPAGSPVS